MNRTTCNTEGRLGLPIEMKRESTYHRQVHSTLIAFTHERVSSRATVVRAIPRP